jgi:hypothetical protein
MSDGDAQQVIFDELKRFLEPILSTDGEPEEVFNLLAAAGWNIEDVLGPAGSRVVDAIGRLITLASRLTELIETPPKGVEDLAPALEDTAAILQVLRELPREVQTALPIDAAELPIDLLNALTVHYLFQRSPAAYHLLRLLTVVRELPPEPIVAGGTIVRFRHLLPKLELSRLADVFSDPERVFREEYWPNGLADRPTVNAVARRLFPRMAAIVRSFGGTDLREGRGRLIVTIGRDLGSAPSALPDQAELVSPFTFHWETELPDEGDTVRLGASVDLLPGTEGGPGVSIVPFGAATIGERLGDWYLEIGGELAFGGFQITEAGFSILEGGDVSTSLRLLIARMPEEGPALRIGSAEGTRFEIEMIALEGEVGYSEEVADLGLMLNIANAALVIKAGEDDGFLRSILPEEGARLEFGMKVGWNTVNGFHFEGSGGFEIKVPAHIDVGPIRLEDVTIRALFRADGVPITLGAGIRAQLGPLTAVVENMGVSLAFTFPTDGGNLGPVDLSPGFKPPDGIGLSIDAGGFTGGGYLSFEPDQHRYSGVLEITFSGTISLKAIGLLTTQLPDRSEGFSLLIIITAEFTPIQLGMGFTLNGVGGLLGLNRTTKIDVLREGVKTNALASVLFPRNVVANATRLISDLQQIFPPEKDRFVFGPMAKFGWGTPSLLTVELGLLIEVPSPVRIAILGVVKLILPDEQSALLQIQVNFLGAWEEDKKLISFDASLFDSRVLAFPLAGDMALRIAYGDNPNFLISVGGFHPAYTPPPLALPEMVRLSLSLMTGDNPRLSLEAYFAVTSNSVQLGAKLELLVQAGKFNVHGYLAFDGLFQFSPFFFTVSIAGGLVVRNGVTVLFGLTFALSLSGPTPWNAKGTATFEILFFKIAVSFDETWGEERDTTLPDIEVLPKLLEALSARGNWEARLPDRTRILVTLRELKDLPPEEILVHPAGTIVVKQKIVPLDMAIQRFGAQKPSDAHRFTLQGMHSGGRALPVETVLDLFAPYQYLEGDASQKLSSRSFESMAAGLRASGGQFDLGSSRVVSRTLRYETIVVDTRLRLSRLGTILRERLDTFRRLLSGSAISQSRLSKLNAERLRQKFDGAVAAGAEGFTIVSVDDLLPFDGQSSFTSQAAATVRLQDLVSANPALDGELQVVPDYELRPAA